MVSAVRVRGYRELNQAFAAAGKAEVKELRDALREAAEPVRADSEKLARENISRIGESWSQMRVGVTTRVVYVAPKQRARSGNPALKRPNVAVMLMGRAMGPAVDRNTGEIEARVGHVLDTVGRTWAVA